MAYGKYPRYEGISLASEVLKDPDVLRELPELRNLRLPAILKNVNIGTVFSAESIGLAQATLGMSRQEVIELREKFWDLFDIHDRTTPDKPRTYEENAILTELDKLREDLEQEALFGVYIPPEELTKKKERARKLHNKVRALKGKPPKAAKEE